MRQTRCRAGSVNISPDRGTNRSRRSGGAWRPSGKAQPGVPTANVPASLETCAAVELEQGNASNGTVPEQKAVETALAHPFLDSVAIAVEQTSRLWGRKGGGAKGAQLERGFRRTIDSGASRSSRRALALSRKCIQAVGSACACESASTKPLHSTHVVVTVAEPIDSVVRANSTICRRYSGAYRLVVIVTPPDHSLRVPTKAGQLQYAPCSSSVVSLPRLHPRSRSEARYSGSGSTSSIVQLSSRLRSATSVILSPLSVVFR